MKKIRIEILEECHGHETLKGGLVGPRIDFKEGQEVEVEASLAKGLVESDSARLIDPEQEGDLDAKKTPLELRLEALNKLTNANLKEVLTGPPHGIEGKNIKGLKKGELIDLVMLKEFPGEFESELIVIDDEGTVIRASELK